MDKEEEELLTSSEVAEIWNARAREAGFNRKYTRRSVNYHCTHPPSDPALKPAKVTKLGNFFTRKQAEEFPIEPERGRKPLDEAA